MNMDMIKDLNDKLKAYKTLTVIVSLLMIMALASIIKDIATGVNFITLLISTASITIGVASYIKIYNRIKDTKLKLKENN